VDDPIYANRIFLHAEDMLDDRTQPQLVRKCLVVDVHAAFRQVIRDFLSRAAVEVIECHNGAEALRVYAESRPDWTLMDVELPGMDLNTNT
jgi:CheY-like chemotaxis protein